MLRLPSAPGLKGTVTSRGSSGTTLASLWFLEALGLFSRSLMFTDLWGHVFVSFQACDLQQEVRLGEAKEAICQFSNETHARETGST